MIDNKFDKTERFLNIESSDIFFVKEGDKAVACKFAEFEFYWPSFSGRMMLSKLGIVTAEGKRYTKGVYPIQLYAHPEEIVGGEPYILSVGDCCFLNIDIVVEKTGIEIPNFIDGEHYAIAYKWDGFKPVECRLGVYYDVLRREVRCRVSESNHDVKFYLTREECAKDNTMKVVLFANN